MNQLGGGFPPGFGNYSQLRVLNVGRNNLTGELLNDIFDVKLLLPSNQIQGTLDTENIAKLSNLVALHLGYNALTGELMEFISQLSKLEKFWLGNNNLRLRLDGPIHAGIPGYSTGQAKPANLLPLQTRPTIWIAAV